MTGCTHVSEACEHCYARRMAGRFERCYICGGRGARHRDICSRRGYFTPTFHPERLDKPLHWRKPRRIFVCSMSDLFHEAFTWDQRWDVLDVVEDCPQHTFIVLTKRAREMHDFFAANEDRQGWPPANLWLGVTVENQAHDERIPILLDTPAAVRFVCCEPLLGAVDLHQVDEGPHHEIIDWVIAGGENGPGARSMQPEWALDLWRQCKATGVPFWFKGWGAAGDPFLLPGGDRYSKDDYADMLRAEETRELPAVSP